VSPARALAGPAELDDRRPLSSQRTAGAGRLPKVIFSSVVRSTNKGEAHGGLYLADLQTGAVEQVLDWSDPSIDWEGRGGDRGLRGIAFHGDHILLSASDEIFVYDKEFRPLGSFGNRYLKRCHEIGISGDRLFLTSTGFDAVLEYDLVAEAFVRGYHLRSPERMKLRRQLHLRPRPKLASFDPNGDDGPSPGDTSHVNNVFPTGDAVFVSGTRMGSIWAIRDGRLDRYARIPYGSHNARPFRDGVLLNHTATDRVAFMDRRGHVLKAFPLKRYDRSELVRADLPADRARPSFGRGLAVLGDDLIVGGSSPATITLYRFEPARVVASINVTKDVRNAIHGLEIWPFDGAA
jgi:hypothetical protein